MGDDMVDQVRRRLRHAPGAAPRTEAAPLAAESGQFVMAAVAAPRVSLVIEGAVALAPDAVFEALGIKPFVQAAPVWARSAKAPG
jgi:hypothetical protein